MNTFDDDNDLGLFEEPRRRPPRERQRGPRRSGPRRSAPNAGSGVVLRLAGLVALAVAIVVGLVLACSSPARDGYVSYRDSMKTLAHKSASVGGAFATDMTTSGLTLEQLQADLANWEQTEKNAYLAAQRLQPPGPLQSAHAEALAAFLLRAIGLQQISATLASAQANHEPAAVAAADLARDAQLLTASDIDWYQLYKLPAAQTLSEQHIHDVIIPDSTIVTNPEIVSAHSLSILYQRVGAPSTSTKGCGCHGSALLYTNAVEGGQTTQLSTSTATNVTAGTGSNLVLDVVFKNSGSYPEVNVKVTLSVNVRGASVWSTSQTVPQIAAGEQQTVSFDNLQVPTSAFGNNASISVNIEKVPKEARVDNNAATYPVLFLLAKN